MDDAAMVMDQNNVEEKMTSMDAEEGLCDMESGIAIHTNISNQYTKDEIRNDTDISNYYTKDESRTDRIPTNDLKTQTISFREILPKDRKQIQKLFEEWFPVDYKEDFYDSLCNQRKMGDQNLYTLLATVPTASVESDVEATHSNGDNHMIIACLLGCKLGACRLNEKSRSLLIPGYETQSSANGNTCESSTELDQTIDELDASGDPNVCNDPKNGDGDSWDDINRTEVFYIMTLGVIEEYRKRGLASYLVERALQEQIVVKQCENEELETDETGISSFDTSSSSSHSSQCRCETAYLHVIIQNQAAIRFYEKLGFSRLREIADYYTIDNEKHNCYLYAKFFDMASIEKRQEWNWFLQLKGYFSAAGSSMILVSIFQKTLTRWITTIWLSLSNYRAFHSGRTGRNSAVAKNK